MMLITKDRAILLWLDFETGEPNGKEHGTCNGDWVNLIKGQREPFANALVLDSLFHCGVGYFKLMPRRYR